MRDFQQRYGVNNRVETLEPTPSCWTLPPQVVDTQYVSYERARSDKLNSDGHAPTAYNAYEITRSPGTLDYEDVRIKRLCYPREYYNKVYSGHYVQNLWVQLSPYGSTHLPIVSHNVKEACKAQLLNKLNSEVNIAQTLGEIPGSAQQMYNQVKSAVKGLNALRKGNFAGAMKHFGATKRGYKPKPGRRGSKAAANSYLAAKYGWFPIMQDAYNVHSAIMKFLSDSEQAFIDISATQVDGAGPFFFGASVFSGNAKQGCQMGVRYSVSSSTLAGLNSTGLINPLSLAWELLPLSFVYDWFVDVGSFLAGLSAPVGLNFRHGYETSFIHTDGEIIDLTKSVYPYSGKASFKIKEFGMERRAISSWPKPSLYIKFGLNSNQLLTLGALFAQRRK